MFRLPEDLGSCGRAGQCMIADRCAHPRGESEHESEVVPGCVHVRCAGSAYGVDHDRSGVDRYLRAGELGSGWTRWPCRGPARCSGWRTWTRCSASDPWSSGRCRAPADRSLLLEELLHRSRELARQALLPLQQPASALLHVGWAADRPQASRISVVGRLQRRLAA